MSSSNRPGWNASSVVGPLGLIGILAAPTITLPAVAATSLAPSVQPPAAAAVDIQNEYVLGAGDRLKAEFFGVPEFSQDYQVLPNGSLNLPRVGGVTVAGMTLRQASAVIGNRYRRYLTRPLVTLSLVAGRPVNVAIAGEINRPGAYGMSSALLNGNSVNSVVVPTLTQLIKQAEGITQAADLAQVKITRRHATGTSVRQVNLWQLLRAGDASQDIRLQDGDSIYIPATANIDLAAARERTRTNISTNSNRPLRIAIVGEVNRPGPYTIFEGAQNADGRTATPNSIAPTITKALQISGGITQMADLRNIHVHRQTHNGQAQRIKVDFWELLKSGDVLQDLPLQDGDRIEIARASTPNKAELSDRAKASFSPDKIAVNVVGEVERPGSVSINPNAPLNEGLFAAGGFNKRARKRNVTLVRLEPDGTASKREIAIDFSKGRNEQTNPSLRDGDTIIVKRSGLAGVGDSLGILSAPITGAFSVLRLLGIVR
ncbi:SLBB domain-containing protein [filamentous cyanobacterium LEGE 11480]|uniref:SLBB domain-containing protein n=1 Tax=Romeriopsis navalis LEGE 11480 TaxID=2777977 RepID=A0A928VKG4_9CYAN|nr:SLBB domain-containing protein [Romeriopsis navalis]MBE9030253.1 SLBB domain-containing protein [Romeriopsis navalis LEGE 11480]